MAIPWYLKPDWLLHAEFIDQQAAHDRALSAAHAREQSLEKQVSQLQKQVKALQAQLGAVEFYLVDLTEQGVLPPPPEIPEPELETPPGRKPKGEPVRFPARTKETVACANCGRRQTGNRDGCYSCGTKFLYDAERGES